MASKNWIEIRAGVGGQPTLVEDRSALAALETIRFHPRVIAAIGSHSKRVIFGETQAGSVSKSYVQGIRLSPWSKSQLLIDCEMHESAPLATVKVLPPTGSRRQHSLHVLISRTHSHQALLRLSFDFYWQVIFPFTPLVLLFLDDIGDDDMVIELLAGWVTKSVASPALSPPRLIIVHENENDHIPEFLTQLRLRLAAAASRRAAPRVCAEADAVPRCETAFERIEILPAAAISLPFVDAQIEEAFSYREKAGFAFSAEHLAYLLEAAVDFFCDGHGRQLDLYHATRLANPSHKDLEPHIAHFMHISPHLVIDREELIASALDFNAHPPRMHYFQPGHEFDKFYLTTVAKLDKFARHGRFTTRIRRRYIELASERHGGSSARLHLGLLAHFRSTWRDCKSHKTCLVCLAQRPSNSLSCGHTLCDPCVIVCGTNSIIGSWNVEVRICPLCNRLNKKPTSLRPPTAGIRILAIEGPLLSKLTLWQFLRDLHYYIGMQLPTYKHFDSVFGSGIGSFFALTLFLERWDLGDCKYHMKNLSNPSLQKSTSLVSFGRGLEWDVDEVLRSNGALACLQIHEKTYSNISPQLTKPETEEIKRNADIYIQATGEGCNVDRMRAAAARLIACLFYIELLSPPTFYSASEYVHIIMKCRLSQGRELSYLVESLYRLKTLVHHHGDEAQPTSELLVTSKLLDTCQQGGPFFKHLRIKVDSFHTRLNIQIDGLFGGKEDISNCPYQLDKLITDQGLRQVFGSKDHRISNEPPDPEYEANGDIIRLRDTLERVIVSYSQLAGTMYSPDGTHPALEIPKSLSTARRKGAISNRFRGWI